MADSAALLAAINALPAPPPPLLLPPAAPSGAVATVCARPYDFPLPVGSTAVVMIDFQRDFMLPGGFGATLGNDVGLLMVRLAAQQARHLARHVRVRAPGQRSATRHI